MAPSRCGCAATPTTRTPGASCARRSTASSTGCTAPTGSSTRSSGCSGNKGEGRFDAGVRGTRRSHWSPSGSTRSCARARRRGDPALVGRRHPGADPDVVARPALLRPARRRPGSPARSAAPRRRAGTASTNGSAGAADPMDVRHARLVLLWGTNTKLTNRHLWPFIEEAQSRRRHDGRGDRPAPHADRRGRRLVRPAAPRHRRGADARPDARARARRPDRPRLRRRATPSASTTWPSGWPTGRPERAAAVCGLDAGGDRAAGPRLRHHHARPSSARSSAPSTTSTARCSSARSPACRCSPAPGATAAAAWPARVGGWCGEANVDDSVFDARQLAAGGRCGHQHEPPRSGAHRPGGRPPVMALFVWNGNPLVSVPNAGSTREGSPGTTCSPWSASSS